mmetsp:Transcript_5177/g.4668  ORF Transcript_5177/g.4668 Transcript_5177/m.4668 type:complete len:749 (-) Transcript_5177:13-2259(-)
MLNTAFSIKLDYPIQKNLVTIGKFDGKTPSIAFATTGGKICLHSPHNNESNQSISNTISPSIKFLNFNRNVTALTAGSFKVKDNDIDYLFVGTNNNVLAYNVDRNSDIFFKDVQDGVNTLVIGKMNGISNDPVLFVGGNCSLLGFNEVGKEIYWTVTGDNITSLELCDTNNDGINELLVGSDDYEIRIFQNENILDEITEADKILYLKKLTFNRFIYGLSNGTVGVYNGLTNTRLWRVKTKNKVTAINTIDIDGDMKVLIGWSNGTFNLRNPDNGEIIYKDKFNSSISSILTYDYRLDGKENVIICCESGEIKGYVPSDIDLSTVNDTNPLDEDQKLINELQNNKLNLMNELRNIEKTLKLTKSPDVIIGGLPSSTIINYNITPDLHLKCLELKVIVTPPDVIINNIVAIDYEGAILDNCEVFAVAPAVYGKPGILPLRPSKFNACTIKIQTHVAVRGMNNQLHVFEKDIQLPKFSTFLKLPDTINIRDLKIENFVINEPIGKVSFKISETTSRLYDFINANFILPAPLKPLSVDNIRIYFVSVCGSKLSLTKTMSEPGQSLYFVASRDQSNSTLLKVQIRCDNMDVVGEIIQEMGKFLNISDLSSDADFPDDFNSFQEVIDRVTEYNSTRVKLATDMADDSQMVKALIIRAEDSRLLTDMKTMRRAYTDLYSLNNQLISNYNQRTNNHDGLVNALKEVNQMIQRASNLRLGKSKTVTISDCRNAIKSNNMKSLIRIMKQGYDSKSYS